MSAYRRNRSLRQERQGIERRPKEKPLSMMIGDSKTKPGGATLCYTNRFPAARSLLLPCLTAGRSPDLRIDARRRLPGCPVTSWRALPVYSDGFAQDLHLFPFSPEHCGRDGKAPSAESSLRHLLRIFCFVCPADRGPENGAADSQSERLHYKRRVLHCQCRGRKR